MISFSFSVVLSFLSLRHYMTGGCWIGNGISPRGQLRHRRLNIKNTTFLQISANLKLTFFYFINFANFYFSLLSIYTSTPLGRVIGHYRHPLDNRLL